MVSSRPRRLSRPLLIPDTPRWIPLLVQVRVLFGGLLSQIGWGLLGFGMIFVWVFAANADFSALTFNGPIKTAPGVVTSSKNTNASENERPVHELRYTFMTPDERTHQGVCYNVGEGRSAGSKVTVEYIEGQPQMSRIQGMRRGMFSPLVLLVTIVPLVGLVLLLVGWRKGAGNLRLLKVGALAEGRLIGTRRTAVQVNNRVVLEHTFEFVADDGRTYKAVGRTHTDRLQDEAAEPLLYDPADPARSAMLGALPGDPRIDENGEIRLQSPLVSLAVLILPLLTLVGNGIYLLCRA